MEERPNESFRFMEELITSWLEGAHRTEIARILDAIKSELRKRALAEGERFPSPVVRDCGRRDLAAGDRPIVGDERPAAP